MRIFSFLSEFMKTSATDIQVSNVASETKWVCYQISNVLSFLFRGVGGQIQYEPILEFLRLPLTSGKGLRDKAKWHLTGNILTNKHNLTSHYSLVQSRLSPVSWLYTVIIQIACMYTHIYTFNVHHLLTIISIFPTFMLCGRFNPILNTGKYSGTMDTKRFICHFTIRQINPFVAKVRICRKNLYQKWKKDDICY